MLKEIALAGTLLVPAISGGMNSTILMSSSRKILIFHICFPGVKVSVDNVMVLSRTIPLGVTPTSTRLAAGA
jgi:hypothetical protein